MEEKIIEEAMRLEDYKIDKIAHSHKGGKDSRCSGRRSINSISANKFSTHISRYSVCGSIEPSLSAETQCLIYKDSRHGFVIICRPFAKIPCWNTCFHHLKISP